jgi:glycosyltransferase involved in cell wall biosynthesis
MDLVYVSNGNIPSRWAHTFQTMKMAEAIARQAKDFRLLMATDFYDLLWPRFDLWSWYGIRRRFRITRLPLWWRRESPEFRRVSVGRFVKVARVYLQVRRPRVVVTRSTAIAERCARLAIPFIFETHSDPKGSELSSFREIFASDCLRGTVTISEVLRERYVELGMPDDRAVVEPSGVDAWRVGSFGERRETRRRLGLPEGQALVVYSGQLFEEKGISTLLVAADSLPQVTFVFVGGWPEDVARCAARAEGKQNVRFLGFVAQDQVPLYQSSADVCVLPNTAGDPSAQWTSPLKLFEYMASGRAIVASAIPAVRRYLRDGHNSLLFEADNAGALTDAIRRALADRGLADRISRQALEDVRAYTWDQRAKRILTRFAPELLRTV